MKLRLLEFISSDSRSGTDAAEFILRRPLKMMKMIWKWLES
jgi:hypothetical protein